MPLTNWTLEADEVLALPIDDLALRVLKDAHDTSEWNWRNWLLKAKNGYQGRKDVAQALSEAWTWLINRGLIVWNPDQDAVGAFVISRQGHQALDRGLLWVQAVQRLDIQMVPVLEAKARPQFLRGDFEAAAFMAMKEVEVRVRELAGLSNSVIGKTLMTDAFRPPKNANDPNDRGGPLWDPAADPGEAVALMELFKGAFGTFKNPASHRRVDFADPTEAAEVVLLADLLMRLLDKIAVAQNAATSP
ncbi:TIGR02391 family protein [Streptomyces mirabilis]|uniref:TIGR02391 family protein n=1 Tax=Streptomyces mirabilis TaxID=68239 RepID=UPI0033E6B006